MVGSFPRWCLNGLFSHSIWRRATSLVCAVCHQIGRYVFYDVWNNESFSSQSAAKARCTELDQEPPIKTVASKLVFGFYPELLETMMSRKHLEWVLEHSKWTQAGKKGFECIGCFTRPVVGIVVPFVRVPGEVLTNLRNWHIIINPIFSRLSFGPVQCLNIEGIPPVYIFVLLRLDSNLPQPGKDVPSSRGSQYALDVM